MKADQENIMFIFFIINRCDGSAEPVSVDLIYNCTSYLYSGSPFTREECVFSAVKTLTKNKLCEFY